MSILNVATDIIKLIKKRGFDADIVVYEENEISITQRLLKIEDITQSMNCSIGLRVIIDKNKFACIETNDFANIDSIVERAIDMATFSPGDPNIALAEPEDFFSESPVDLKILDRENVGVEDLKKFTHTMENSALSYDKNITNSEGASASYKLANATLVTSNGFVNSYSKSIFSASVSVVAGSANNMEIGYDYSIKCHFNDLKKPAILGKNAANKALKSLNARKIKTCVVPVLFDKKVADKLLKSFASAINGNSIANGTSFLMDSVGKLIFNTDISIIDDQCMIKGVASRPFDGEGIGSKRNVVVKNGVLENLILDIHSANQLKLKTTGNAVRASNASISPKVSNFYIENGRISLDDMILDIKNGLYVTDLFGFGINIITGDYSQGAAGFWIENGKIAYPVNEITVAGNLKDMFLNLIVSNDLEYNSSINSPSMLINKMTVAGSN